MPTGAFIGFNRLKLQMRLELALHGLDHGRRRLSHRRNGRAGHGYIAAERESDDLKHFVHNACDILAEAHTAHNSEVV